MAITFEDICKVNQTIKTTDIKGKEYAEVNQRIKAFRMLFPQGFILTEMKSNEDGMCVFVARVGFRDLDGEHILGTGTAYEQKDSTFINQTSYIENCETSAVGRALGMAGIGIDTAVASAEEVQNAIANQKQDQKQESTEEKAGVKKASPRQIEILSKIYTGENLSKLLSANNIEKLEDMPMTKASYLISKLSSKQKGDENNG